MEEWNDWHVVLPVDYDKHDSARPSQLQGRNRHPPSNDDGNGHEGHNGTEQGAEIEADYDAANKKAPTVETTTTSDETATSEHTAQPPANRTTVGPALVVFEHYLTFNLTEDSLARFQLALKKERAVDLRWWLEDDDDSRPGVSHSHPSGSGATHGSAKKSQTLGDGAAAHDDYRATGSQFPHVLDRPLHISDF